MDVLHTFVSPWMLLFFAVLVGAKMEFGSPIVCLFPTDFNGNDYLIASTLIKTITSDAGSWKDYFLEYCFITNTYRYDAASSANSTNGLRRLPEMTINYYQVSLACFN